MNRIKFLSIVVFMAATEAVFAAQSKIAFDVSFIEPQAHYVEVGMQVSGIAKESVDIKMPVWTPGSYLIREFAKSIESVNAVSASGKALKVVKIDKNTWRVASAKADFTLNYRVYAFEISVRTAFVDASHAFLSPASVFMYVAGMISHPVTVNVKPFKTWSKISTGLEPVSGKVNTFYAPDFDILYDSPIEVGNQDVFEFKTGGTRYEVSMYGGGNYNKERIKVDMPKIIETETQIFGENPNKHYVFIVHNYNVGSGGLEHLNSTVLGVARSSYNTEAGYQAFLRLVAHEHFHLWNVKRLRPIALGPFDYERENYTTNLWIAEGFTSYYDKLCMHRAGFTTAEKYLEGLVGEIGTIENQPGNKLQSASEASFDAWIKYYRPNENSKNTTISYYNKGALIAMLLDLEIINATKGEKGLDDLMQAMYKEYYKKQKRGYTDAEFRAMAEKFAGRSLDKIYDNYVNGTKPIDYNTWFGYAGLKLNKDSSLVKDPTLGLTLTVANNKTVVANVVRGTSGWNGGINVNDELIAIDGIRLTNIPVETGKVNEVDQLVNAKKVGDTLMVTLIRDGLVQTIAVPLIGNPNSRYKLTTLENITQMQSEVRRKWLSL